MIYTSENNWYAWNYDNDTLFGLSKSNNDTFNTYYGKYKFPITHFKNELIKATKNTLDHYAGLRPCIFFSGGLDSEILLRSYIEVQSTPKVLIFRYEKDYNIYDVSHAVKICSLLNIDYKIIDFNLKKFFENDAEHISEISQIDRPRALPQLKFLDYIEDSQFGIYGIGDPRWARVDNDYSKKSGWHLIDQEHDSGWDKFLVYKNIPAIAQWFKWTPGLVLSYTKLNWFKNLINDKFTGKLGVNSTKYIGYSEIYSNLIYRKKQTGFELIDDLILDFESYLNKKYNGFPFRRYHIRTLDQLWKEITDLPYLENT